MCRSSLDFFADHCLDGVHAKTVSSTYCQCLWMSYWDGHFYFFVTKSCILCLKFWGLLSGVIHKRCFSTGLCFGLGSSNADSVSRYMLVFVSIRDSCFTLLAKNFNSVSKMQFLNRFVRRKRLSWLLGSKLITHEFMAKSTNRSRRHPWLGKARRCRSFLGNCLSFVRGSKSKDSFLVFREKDFSRKLIFTKGLIHGLLSSFHFQSGYSGCLVVLGFAFPMK